MFSECLEKGYDILISKSGACIPHAPLNYVCVVGMRLTVEEMMITCDIIGMVTSRPGPIQGVGVEHKRTITFDFCFENSGFVLLITSRSICSMLTFHVKSHAVIFSSTEEGTSILFYIVSDQQ